MLLDLKPSSGRLLNPSTKVMQRGMNSNYGIRSFNLLKTNILI